jgi:hypothetical protein
LEVKNEVGNLPIKIKIAIFVYFFLFVNYIKYFVICVFVCCVLFVYFLCIVFRFKSYKWLRGPRLPVVIQWGSAEVKRLRTAALHDKNQYCTDNVHDDDDDNNNNNNGMGKGSYPHPSQGHMMRIFSLSMFKTVRA